jgi:hypothetical protein
MRLGKVVYSKSYNHNNITLSESFYKNSTHISNFKIKTTKVNINEILSLSKILTNFSFFNYNIDTNLNLAKQQR